MSIIGLKTGPVDVKDSNSSGDVAKGLALAEQLVSEIERTERGTWVKVYVKGMMELDQQGRRVFRKKIAAWIKTVRENALANKGDGVPEQMAKRAANSAVVRASQCNRIARAMDMGYRPDLNHSFAHILATAGGFLESTANAGPTVQRGRPTKNTIEKVKSYLARLVKAGELDTAGLHQVAEVAEDLAEHPEQVKAAA